MKQLLCALLTIFAIAAVPTLSADSPAEGVGTSIDGFWVGQVQIGPDTLPVHMSVVHIEDTHVGGAVILNGGGEIGIRDGFADGASLRFVTYEANLSTAQKFTWTGAISGDEISLLCTSDDPRETPVQMILRRQK